MWRRLLQTISLEFDPEFSGNIFNLCQRLHPKDKFQGGGIGLAVKKKIIEKLNDLIRVESLDTLGSVLILKLPIRQARVQPLCMTTTKILLADDDDDDREVFNTVISTKPDVTLIRCLENGREVIEFLDRLPEESLPDIIILDQNMPKMNGIETLEYLKAHDRYARITVAIYSTFTDARLVEKYRKLGAALVLTKPSRMEDYNTLVNNILNLLNQRT